MSRKHGRMFALVSVAALFVLFVARHRSSPRIKTEPVFSQSDATLTPGVPSTDVVAGNPYL
jgi:hypothetical protein